MSNLQKTPVLLVAVLIFSGVLASAQFAKISVPIEFLIERFEGKGALIGFLVSTISFVGMISGLFVGVLLARIGFRKLLLAALFFGAALSFSQMLPLSFPLFLVTRAFEGASHLIIVVAAPTLIGQICAPKHRSIGLTLWSTVFGMAFAVFTFGGLPLVEHLGLSLLFFAHGALMLLAGLIVWRILPSGLVPRSDVPLTWRAIRERHLKTYTSAWICAPALGWFFYAMGFIALVTVIPLFFAPQTPLFIKGMLPLSALIVSLTFGLVLVRLFQPITVAIFGFVLSACCAVSMAFGVPVEVAAMGMISALGLVQAGTFSAVPVLVPRGDEQALANGAIAQMGNAGNVVGTPLLFFLTAHWDILGAVVFAVTLFGLGALCHIWLAMLRQR